MIDYATALVLIVVPLLFLGGGGAVEGAAAEAAEAVGAGGDRPAAIWVLVVSGVLLLGLGALTRYELGLVKTVPMQAHLYTDMGLGVFLIVSPWLLGFADLVWWPHVVVGALEVGVAAMTRRHSSVETSHATPAAAR
jgi:hypothetical protein